MKKLRWFGALLLAALVLTGGFTAPAMAAEAPTLERIVKSGILRVGMSGDQAPLNMKDRSDKLMGLEVDLAQLLAAAFEVDLRLIEKPFPELLPALKAGEIDMILSGMSITAERAIDVTFVGPYVMSGKSILTKSSLLARALEASDIDASTYKLAVLANSTSEGFVKKYMPHTEPVTTGSYEEAVNLVRQDQADAMVADMPACLLAVLRYPQEELLTLAQPLSIEPIGIAIPANDLQYKNVLENYLDAIEGIGLLELLRKKWFEDGSWVAALP
jgi:polar amino acid transport system substrate-binding protein